MSPYWKPIMSMVKFLEKEPSGKFQAIDNSTDKIYWHYAFREMELEHISKFTNEFDPTQELTLIYLASMCRFLIEHTTCPVMDALRSSPQIKKYSKCLETINSPVITGCRRSVLERLATAVNAISPTKLIGDYEKALGQAVDDGTEASFEFNVETVPGKITIYFPLIVPTFGNDDAMIEYDDKPMSMALGWHMHDIIPIIDKSWCYTYSLDEIKKALKSYVENAEWRNNLHKRFVKRDENGKEIELEKAPDWYEVQIQKIIEKSAIEKDWSKK